MRYAGRSTGAVLLAAGITAAMLWIGTAGKTYASHTAQPPCTGQYVIDSDNLFPGGEAADMDVHIRNDMPNHPVEFIMNVIQAGNYNLTIKAWGVGMSSPDKIKVNGNDVGILVGDDATWIDSSYPVTLNFGDNQIEIYIDDGGPSGMDTIVVGCGIANFSPPVGGITGLTDVGRYPQMAEPSESRFGAREAAMAGSAAAALGLAGAGAGLYYSRRRNR